MLSFIFSISSVQTKLGSYFSNTLQEDFDVAISVDEIDLSYIGKIKLNGVLIRDHHNDTLISTAKLETSLLSLNEVFENSVRLGIVKLYNGKFNLKTYKDEKTSNLTVFSLKFGKPKKPKKKPFELFSEKIYLENVDFQIINENRADNPITSSYKKITGDVNKFKLQGPNVAANLSNVSMVDNFGLIYESFNTNFSYTPKQMLFGETVVKTGNSFLKAEIKFDYDYKDLVYFNDSVQIGAVFDKSYVSLKDLQKIYKEFAGDDVLHFETKFNGALNDFKLKDLDVCSEQHLGVKGDYHLKNSLNKGKDFSLQASIENLSSNYRQLKQVLPNVLGRYLPRQLDKLGEFSIVGETEINSKFIETDVEIESELGVAISQLKLTNIEKIDEANYQGYVKVTDFDLGDIVEDPNIGLVSFEGDVKGKGFLLANMNTSLVGKVSKHQYKGYTYRNIKVNGLFRNKHFNGFLSVRDKNIHLDFQGLANFSKRKNKFDFKAKVDFANFNKLNLFKRDSIAVLKGDITMDFTGNSLDDIVGRINFLNSSYTNPYKTFEFKDFTIESTLIEDVKTIKIASEDIAKGQLKGIFKLGDLGHLARNSIGSMLANYKPLIVKKNQYFEFDFEIYNEIVEVFLPKVRVASNTIIKGKVVDENNEIKVLFKAPKVAISKFVLDSVHVQIDNKNPALNTNFAIKEIISPSYTVRDVTIFNKTLNDTLFFRSDFTGGKLNDESFDMSFYYTYDKNKKSVVGIQNSNIRFKQKNWVIAPKSTSENKVVFDLTKEIYDFQDFTISTNNQQIKFAGTVRDSTYKDLKVSFDKVSLNAITPKIDSLLLKGTLNGELNFKQKNGVYQPYGEMSINDFEINGASQGDLMMNVVAEQSFKKYNVDMQLVSNSYKNLLAKGVVDLTPRRPVIDLDVDLSEFKLNAFSPLGKNVLSRIRGIATGKFHVNGLLSNPNMDGELYLKNTGLSFPFLNIDYNFSNNSKVVLNGQSFLLKELNLVDTKYETTGLLNGSISHESFKDWQLDLNIASDRLLVLDTKDREGASYYGTGFMDGEAKIFGTTNNLTIDLKAKTLEGTRFVIPLSDVRSIENSSLIHFKEKEKVVDDFFVNQELLKKTQGLNMNFELDVTKDAEAEIVIDRVSGSSLKGLGSGNLLIEMDSKGKFNMFGDYLIEKGIYNLVYGGVINKPFEVQKGGLISWDGDPYKADLNLTAVHKVKANPKVLLENLNVNRKIDVDLVTTIRGELFNSTEEFDVLIPNSSSMVASELEFKLNDNDDNTKMRQFFSLLISKSFFNENNLSANGSSAITGTTSDIISGALSDVFNKEGDKFQIDLGYTAGDRTDIEQQNIDDQVDISLATQINDRILINGKVGVPVGARTQSSVVGEVKVEFLVDDEGNLRWTFFNRQNEIQYSDEEEGYTQGIGLTYQLDFNTFGEVLDKLGIRNQKKTLKNSDRSNDIPSDLILVVPSLI